MEIAPHAQRPETAADVIRDAVKLMRIAIVPAHRWTHREREYSAWISGEPDANRYPSGLNERCRDSATM
jgi:hypothetical protein